MRLQWQQLQSASPPQTRAGHTATLIADQLIVIGGESAGSCTNEVFALHTESLKWHELQPDGIVPSARLGHAACCVEGSTANRTSGVSEVWIFGGGDGKVLLRDVWAFEPSSRKWRNLSCGGVRAAARIGHALAYLPSRDSIVSCGGFVKGVPGGYSMQVLLLHLPTLSWSQVQTVTAPGDSPPSGRLGAAICALEKGERVLLLGGSAFGSLLDDALLLDMQSCELTRVAQVENGAAPHPRANGAAISVPPFVLHVGGSASGTSPIVDILDVERQVWHAVGEQEGAHLFPASRQKHAMIAVSTTSPLPGQTRVRALAWGGEDLGVRPPAEQVTELAVTVQTAPTALPTVGAVHKVATSLCADACPPKCPIPMEQTASSQKFLPQAPPPPPPKRQQQQPTPPLIRQSAPPQIAAEQQDEESHKTSTSHLEVHLAVRSERQAALTTASSPDMSNSHAQARRGATLQTVPARAPRPFDASNDGAPAALGGCQDTRSVDMRMACTSASTRADSDVESTNTKAIEPLRKEWMAWTARQEAAHRVSIHKERQAEHRRQASEERNKQTETSEAAEAHYKDLMVLSAQLDAAKRVQAERERQATEKRKQRMHSGKPRVTGQEDKFHSLDAARLEAAFRVRRRLAEERARRKAEAALQKALNQDEKSRRRANRRPRVPAGSDCVQSNNKDLRSTDDQKHDPLKESNGVGLTHSTCGGVQYKTLPSPPPLPPATVQMNVQLNDPRAVANGRATKIICDSSAANENYSIMSVESMPSAQKKGDRERENQLRAPDQMLFVSAEPLFDDDSQESPCRLSGPAQWSSPTARYLLKLQQSHAARGSPSFLSLRRTAKVEDASAVTSSSDPNVQPGLEPPFNGTVTSGRLSTGSVSALRDALNEAGETHLISSLVQSYTTHGTGSDSLQMISGANFDESQRGRGTAKPSNGSAQTSDQGDDGMKTSLSLWHLGDEDHPRRTGLHNLQNNGSSPALVSTTNANRFRAPHRLGVDAGASNAHLDHASAAVERRSSGDSRPFDKQNVTLTETASSVLQRIARERGALSSHRADATRREAKAWAELASTIQNEDFNIAKDGAKLRVGSSASDESLDATPELPNVDLSYDQHDSKISQAVFSCRESTQKEQNTHTFSPAQRTSPTHHPPGPEPSGASHVDRRSPLLQDTQSWLKASTECEPPLKEATIAQLGSMQGFEIPACITSNGIGTNRQGGATLEIRSREHRRQVNRWVQASLPPKEDDLVLIGLQANRDAALKKVASLENQVIEKECAQELLKATLECNKGEVEELHKRVVQAERYSEAMRDTLAVKEDEIQELKRRVIEAESARELMCASLEAKADEVEELRISLHGAAQSSPHRGSSVWKARANALEQKLAESEARLQQSTLLIARLRRYLGSTDESMDAS